MDTVAILWSDGEKNREYYVVVDEEDDQFKALLKEFAYDSIDECTRKKHEIHRQQFTDAFNNYARENDMLKVESIQEERRASLDILFDFDPENDKDKEELFKLKLKIFEIPAQWEERSEGSSRFKVFKWLFQYLRWYFYGLATTWLKKESKDVK